MRIKPGELNYDAYAISLPAIPGRHYTSLDVICNICPVIDMFYVVKT